MPRGRRRLEAAVTALLLTLPGGSLSCALAAPAQPLEALDGPVGRMLVVGFRGTQARKGSRIQKAIREHRLGGVILFRQDVPSGASHRNIRSPDQLRRLTRSLQEAAPYRLLIAIDQEGGEVARLHPADGFQASPSAASLGEQPVARARRAAQSTAAQLADLGINWNLAPVVDLATKEGSPSIGGLGRSFGAHPEEVTPRAAEVIRAHRAEGVLTAVKHFPGHGSAAEDSHLDLPDITGSWRAEELLPYRRLLEMDLVDTVMVGHLYHRELDSTWPASLSKRVISELLRKRLGFQGPVVTDDLQMRAIRDRYALETTIRRAIRAGADILLFANNTVYQPRIAARAREAMRDLVRGGEIPPERINRSLRRIRKLSRKARGRHPRKQEDDP